LEHGRSAKGSLTHLDARDVEVSFNLMNGRGEPARSGPKSANRRPRRNLVNDRVGQCENLRWQIKAERFGSFKIDHELKPR